MPWITCLISRSSWHSRHQAKVPIPSLNSLFNLFLEREAAFLFYFSSTDMFLGLFSFWQLSSIFWSTVSAAAVSSVYNRLMGRLTVFPFGSSTLAARISLSLLSINCTIFPILHLLLGASSLIWAICPTIRFILDLILGCCRRVWAYCSLKLSRLWFYQYFQNSFRWDWSFSKFPVIHWLIPSVA